MFEGVDTVVLRNELAYHDTLPVALGAARWRARWTSFASARIEEANV